MPPVLQTLVSFHAVKKVCKQGATVELSPPRERSCVLVWRLSSCSLFPCNCSLYWLCQNKPLSSYFYAGTTSTCKVWEWWVHSDWGPWFFKNWLAAWAVPSRADALADSSQPTAGAQSGAGFLLDLPDAAQQRGRVCWVRACLLQPPYRRHRLIAPLAAWSKPTKLRPVRFWKTAQLSQIFQM